MNPSPYNENEELKRLLLEQRQYFKLILASTERTRRYILWGRIMSAIYLVLILAPIILGIIFLPPLIKESVGPYRELLGQPAGKDGVNENLLRDLQDILK